MSAGTAMVHHECNRGPVAMKIFQIGILPDHCGATPNWGSKTFPKATRGRGTAATAFEVLASGRPGDAGSGAVEVNGTPVNARDGAAIRDEAEIVVTAREDAELVLVEAAAA